MMLICCKCDKDLVSFDTSTLLSAVLKIVRDLPCAAQWSRSTGVCAQGLVLLGTTHCRLRLCPAGTHQIHEAKTYTQKKVQLVSVH